MKLRKRFKLLFEMIPEIIIRPSILYSQNSEVAIALPSTFNQNIP